MSKGVCSNTKEQACGGVLITKSTSPTITAKSSAVAGTIALLVAHRFEMPFNVWCDGCGHLIGKGVRFNAEKQAIGNYHSTKIWSFTMTAPCCQQRIEVQTDPKNAQYNVVSGGKQKVCVMLTPATASCCHGIGVLSMRQIIISH